LIKNFISDGEYATTFSRFGPRSRSDSVYAVSFEGPFSESSALKFFNCDQTEYFLQGSIIGTDFSF